MPFDGRLSRWLTTRAGRPLVRPDLRQHGFFVFLFAHSVTVVRQPNEAPVLVPRNIANNQRMRGRTEGEYGRPL